MSTDVEKARRAIQELEKEHHGRTPRAARPGDEGEGRRTEEGELVTIERGEFKKSPAHLSCDECLGAIPKGEWVWHSWSDECLFHIRCAVVLERCPRPPLKEMML